MTSMHSVIPEEKLTEAYRLLLEMRDNCVKHENDQYDDPKREAKYEALNIAMAAMGRSIPSRWISVEESLPEGEVIALCFDRDAYCYGEYIVGYVSPYNELEGVGFRAENDYELLDGVTHWMPLPEPPKETSL